MHKKKRI